MINFFLVGCPLKCYGKHDKSFLEKLILSLVISNFSNRKRSSLFSCMGQWTALNLLFIQRKVSLCLTVNESSNSSGSSNYVEWTRLFLHRLSRKMSRSAGLQTFSLDLRSFGQWSDITKTRLVQRTENYYGNQENKLIGFVIIVRETIHSSLWLYITIFSHLSCTFDEECLIIHKYELRSPTGLSSSFYQ